MQTPQQEKGKAGEEIAAEMLEKKGYRIAERNWRANYGEIDLIAWHGERTLVFVEVKTRGSLAFGKPEEFIGRKKEEVMARTAAAYCRRINWEQAVRFDTVSILLRPDAQPKVEHFEDAFWPGWR